jgi:Ca2+-binding EF-hand superfamily protein
MFGAILVLSCSNAFAQPGGERPAEGRPPEGGDRGPGGRGGRGSFPNPVFDAVDADKDGTISAKELEGAVAALKTLDKDNDGNITREEARPQFGGFGGPGGGGPGGPGGFGSREGGGGPPTAEGFVNSMLERDTNKDGKLSAEELGERGARMLNEETDTNGDKMLDKEELTKAAARMMERFRGGRPGGEGGGGRPPEGEGGGDRPRRPPTEEGAGGDRI